MDNGIYFTDVGQKLVAKTFAFGCALYQTCNVNKFDNSRGDFVRVIHFSQCIQTSIWNCNSTDIWLNGAEWVVCRLCTCVGDRIKKGALANVWQTHNT